MSEDEVLDQIDEGQTGSRAARITIPMATRKDFYTGIARRLMTLLPPELRDFRHRGEFTLMKIWSDHYRIHYEVVLDQQINKIELGLHFEDGPASSLAFLTLLDGRILEIKDHLGPESSWNAGPNHGRGSTSCGRWSRSTTRSVT